MRLEYAIKDLKRQGWFDPFKEVSRDAVYPLSRAFRAAWEELDTLEDYPDKEFFVVPKELWPVDELKEPIEEGWFDWDRKRRRLFVYGPRLAEQLKDLLDLQLRYQRLLKLAREVNDNALNIAREFADVIDANTGGVFGLSDALAQGGSAVTRFLRYRPNPERLNPPHRDRSFFTVHAWESHPGLLLNGSSQDDTGIVCFPGKKLWAATHGTFPALIHGVRDMRPLCIQTHDERLAVVSFVHAALSRDALRFIAEHADEAATYPQ